MTGAIRRVIAVSSRILSKVEIATWRSLQPQSVPHTSRAAGGRSGVSRPDKYFRRRSTRIENSALIENPCGSRSLESSNKPVDIAGSTWRLRCENRDEHRSLRYGARLLLVAPLLLAESFPHKARRKPPTPQRAHLMQPLPSSDASSIRCSDSPPISAVSAIRR